MSELDSGIISYEICHFSNPKLSKFAPLCNPNFLGAKYLFTKYYCCWNYSYRIVLVVLSNSIGD